MRSPSCASHRALITFRATPPWPKVRSAHLRLPPVLMRRRGRCTAAVGATTRDCSGQFDAELVGTQSVEWRSILSTYAARSSHLRACADLARWLTPRAPRMLGATAAPRWCRQSCWAWGRRAGARRLWGCWYAPLALKLPWLRTRTSRAPACCPAPPSLVAARAAAIATRPDRIAHGAQSVRLDLLPAPPAAGVLAGDDITRRISAERARDAEAQRQVGEAPQPPAPLPAAVTTAYCRRRRRRRLSLALPIAAWCYLLPIAAAASRPLLCPCQFYRYAKLWWREFVEIDPSFRSRLVKIFVENERGEHVAACSSLVPLRAGAHLPQ